MGYFNSGCAVLSASCASCQASTVPNIASSLLPLPRHVPAEIKCGVKKFFPSTPIICIDISSDNSFIQSVRDSVQVTSTFSSYIGAIYQNADSFGGLVAFGVPLPE